MVGYRPQLARSGSGFVTGLVLPRGNAADSRHLVAMVKGQITTAVSFRRCRSAWLQQSGGARGSIEPWGHSGLRLRSRRLEAHRSAQWKADLSEGAERADRDQVTVLHLDRRL